MREPLLRGQTVVVIGGTSGIGLETARLARADGAALVLTARDADRLQLRIRERPSFRAWPRGQDIAEERQATYRSRR